MSAHARSPISNPRHSFPVPARGCREIRSMNSDFTTLLSSKIGDSPCPSIRSGERSGRTRNFHSAVPPPSSTPLFFVLLPSFLPERTTRRETTPQSRHHERRTDRIVTLTVAAREETKWWENAVSTRRVAADISACRPNVSAISRARE